MNKASMMLLFGLSIACTIIAARADDGPVTGSYMDGSLQDSSGKVIFRMKAPLTFWKDTITPSKPPTATAGSPAQTRPATTPFAIADFKKRVVKLPEDPAGVMAVGAKLDPIGDMVQIVVLAQLPLSGEAGKDALPQLAKARELASRGIAVPIPGGGKDAVLIATGSLLISDGGPTVWTEGCVHVIDGKIKLNDFTFSSDSDSDPLMFRISAKGGYQYVRGHGVVISPNGDKTELPEGRP